MWPPETGWTARSKIVTVIPMRNDSNKFGVFVSVWMDEMTMVSIAKTRTADPRSSPTDARQSC